MCGKDTLGGKLHVTLSVGAPCWCLDIGGCSQALVAPRSSSKHPVSHGPEEYLMCTALYTSYEQYPHLMAVFCHHKVAVFSQQAYAQKEKQIPRHRRVKTGTLIQQQHAYAVWFPMPSCLRMYKCDQPL